MKRLRFDLFDISKYKNEIYGFSILWIVLFHAIAICDLNYSERFDFLTPLNEAISYGNIGVDIFLFCSGIFAYFSYVKNSDITAFMKKRLLRIYIPVLIIYGWYWICKYLVLSRDPAKFLLKISLLDFWVSGTQEVWFVSLILICYCVYPYIFGFLFKKDIKCICFRYITLVLITASLTLALRYAGKDVYDNVEIAITRIPVFLTGCVLGKAVYERKTLPWIGGGCIIAATVLSFYILHLNLLHNTWRRWWYLLGGVSLTILLSEVLKELKLRTLKPILFFLGKISLELYLTHIMLIKACREFLSISLDSIHKYLILVVASVILAQLSAICRDWIQRI